MCTKNLSMIPMQEIVIFFEKGNEAIILFKSWSRDQGDLQSERNVLWTCSTANQAIKVLEECKQA